MIGFFLWGFCFHGFMFVGVCPLGCLPIFLDAAGYQRSVRAPFLLDLLISGPQTQDGMRSRQLHTPIQVSPRWLPEVLDPLLSGSRPTLDLQMTSCLSCDLSACFPPSHQDAQGSGVTPVFFWVGSGTCQVRPRSRTAR